MRTRGVLLLTLPLVLSCWGEPPDRAIESPEIRSVGGRQQAFGPVSLTASQESGKQVFDILCWTCHGSSGRGDGPAAAAGAVPAPPNLLIGEYPHLAADQFEYRFRAALTGEDDAHPHMRYVTSILEPDKFTDALSYLPALIYPAVIPGSAIAGHVMYQSRCQGCHGVEGRGDGPAAASLLSAPPVDFTQSSLLASRDWATIFTRIRDGGQGRHTSMPPWGVAFTDGEMWDLVAFLGTLQPGVFPPFGEAPVTP